VRINVHDGLTSSIVVVVVGIVTHISQVGLGVVVTKTIVECSINTSGWLHVEVQPFMMICRFRLAHLDLSSLGLSGWLGHGFIGLLFQEVDTGTNKGAEEDQTNNDQDPSQKGGSFTRIVKRAINLGAIPNGTCISLRDSVNGSNFISVVRLVNLCHIIKFSIIEVAVFTELESILVIGF